MEKEDILHLAALSRLRLSDEEVERFKTESAAILGYVDEVQSIALAPRPPVVGALVNPLRADEPTHEPGAYTETLLNALPKRVGQHALVKRILTTEDEA